MMTNTEMTREKGLAFLRAHQPMPDLFDPNLDEELWARLIKEWDEVRDYFEHYPCLEAIPLFFGSIGDNDGCGVYMHLQNILVKFEPEQVVPFIVDALRSTSVPVREFAAECSLVVSSNDPSYIEALINCLGDESEDARSSAAMTLSFLAKDGLFEWRNYEIRLRNLAVSEEDKDVLQYYEEIFNS